MNSTPQHALVNGHASRALNGIVRASMSKDALVAAAAVGGPGSGAGVEDEDREDDPVHQMLLARMADAEARLLALFGPEGSGRRQSKHSIVSPREPRADAPPSDRAKTTAPPKKAARQIDEDDYGDDDDEDEDIAGGGGQEEDDDDDEEEEDSPLKAKSKPTLHNRVGTFTLHTSPPAAKPPSPFKQPPAATDQAKSSEDVRKQLEEDKKAAVETAKRSFQSMFYTLEHDHDAMLEQQKLDELDREVENEISEGPNGTANAQHGSSADGAAGGSATQGTLGSADLGASSLTLKHLIARIDMKRDMVKASDNQLRTLISEVRKGRSKWASEDRVGQEELYEAAEKVMMELKAMTEYAQPFLQRVSKREAPDYFNVIKYPMDIGTMIKKLKQFQYKSKKDFVDDLNLIWSNCLKYNQDPAHPLRKKALYMRKETDKLTPLIPEITVRDRAEVEAEERRLHSIDADDSDDDDAPIMASRGRKAPKKGGKSGPQGTKRAPTGAAAAAAATTAEPTASNAADTKPAPHALASRNDGLRTESEMHDGNATLGFNTPPPHHGGPSTPSLVNGARGSGTLDSQADGMEIDGVGPSLLGLSHEDADEEDTDFKAWKQITKKDRAQAAAERNRLFRGEQLKNLNVEQPALLRTKAMMRRWTRQQKMNQLDKMLGEGDASEGADEQEVVAQSETLAEGIETEEDSTLPDYYNPVSAIPDVNERWRWTTDSEGYAVSRNDEWMRIFPKHQFQSTEGAMTKRMEANMRQMQDTRKIVSKIGIVKQMQVQAQAYQNQFARYEPKPFVEQDVGTVVVSEDGPIMSPWVVRTALQRSVGKIFYHAGFEDFSPSALDTVTDLAASHFARLVETLKFYIEQPRQDANTPRYTFEEQVLHALHEHGTDLESIEGYVKDDIERLGTKLGVVHERMKSHLADLLRPALAEGAAADGAGSFEDGSEQFVGGDFAEDLHEDFFGFRELGLADELGLESLSVPFHLLQNRMHASYNTQNQSTTANNGVVFPPPAPYEPISMETLPNHIGLVQEYFRQKLHNNHFEPLVEDEDLPQKQRFPKPRLPPTGKISSPRKRPIREQQQAAKKKRKLDEADPQAAKALQNPVGKLRFDLPDVQENSGMDPDKDGEVNGPPSPESITAN